MSILGSDNFTGTNTTTLPAHDANWTTLSTSFNDMQLVDNGAKDVTPSGNIYSGVAFPANQYSQVKMQDASILTRAGVVVRAAGGSTDTFYFAGVYPGITGHNRYVIDKYVQGVGRTNLATHASQAIVANDIIKLSVTGTNLSLTVNGTAILATSDSEITSGSPGILGQDDGTIAIMDDWEGGDTAAPSRPMFRGH